MPAQPQLSQAFYASRVTQKGTRAEDILAGSRERNAKLGITGGLVFTGIHFCQVLEGPEENVEMLLSKIRMDLRHQSFTLVYHEPKAIRSFALWTMGYAAMPFADQLIVPLIN
ncbi:BLUF domain-containing protein [uncultured Xylophilus sp.]|uniref:BLUF domain-containing protein n=1 Tax=uncultured Xylophilus sp. TaxID=296832 RepID=UPI0025E591F6|nr:BLUF domain-containing protein [uncultured Xylophilus sp.]